MKYELHIRIFLMIGLLSFLFSCKKSLEPLPESFDQNLVGVWYSTYEMHPFPFPAIYGIRIAEDGYAYPLSVKAETGELVETSDSPSRQYRFASGGILIYRNLGSGFAVNDRTYKKYYRIRNDTLFLSIDYEVSSAVSKPEYSDFMIRSHIGAQITRPISTSFEATLDSVHISNIPVNPYPSAYAYFNSGDLNIIAKITNYGSLHFKLANFTGIGNYDLESSHASYSQISGDIMYSIDTETDSSLFTVEITSFDSSRVRGNFDLEFKHQMHFKNGTFSIPVF